MQIQKLLCWVIWGLIPFSALADEAKFQKLRTDCRFYFENSKFCYASATYILAQEEIKHVQFGVGCNYETIYDDAGIVVPRTTVSDGIRPRTSAFPRVELIPENSLKHPGTYSAKIELSSGRSTDGVCYVSEVSEHGPYIPKLF